MYVTLSGRNAFLGTWKYTLEARDFDGDESTIEGYYDTTLDITWLSDANYAKTNNEDADGKMTWAEANEWVNSVEINGISEWRLPNEKPVNGNTFNFDKSYDATIDNVAAPTTTDGTDGGWRNMSGEPVSEMGDLYYVTLGNQAGHPGPGISNTGPFINIQTTDAFYWSDTESTYINNPVILTFDFNVGYRNIIVPSYTAFVWPVHDGDVGTSISNSSIQQKY